MIGFVLGTGCCGSSLVQEILARHFQVGFVSNLDDRLPRLHSMGRLNRGMYAHVPQEWTRKGRVRFAPSEGYRLLDSEVSPLVGFPGRHLSASDVSQTLVARFRDFFTKRWDAQGTPAFLHKFTGASRINLIAAAFPDARYIHIVRDGRAVANSFLKQDWWLGPGGVGASWRTFLSAEDREVVESQDDSWVLLAGLTWRQLIDDHEADRSLVQPGSWLELRYEDVLADPEWSLAAMAEHLRLDPNERFLAQVRSYRLEASRRDGFRRELEAEQVALLDQHLGVQLARLGYQG